MKFEVLEVFFKILYPVTGKYFLVFNAVLDGLILFHRGDFRGVRCLYNDF